MNRLLSCCRSFGDLQWREVGRYFPSDLLVAVRHKEIRLQLCDVQGKVAHAMCAIYEAQNTMGSCDFCEPFKRQPHTG
jgi:hypothetical protein